MASHQDDSGDSATLADRKLGLSLLVRQTLKLGIPFWRVQEKFPSRIRVLRRREPQYEVSHSALAQAAERFDACLAKALL